MKTPKPLSRFKIYPYRKGVYFVVTVFRTAEEMRAYCEKNCMNPCGPKAGACTHSYSKYLIPKKHRPKYRGPIMGKEAERLAKLSVKGPEIGHIHYNLEWDSILVISHEIDHAAFYTLRDRLNVERLVFSGKADGGGFTTGIEEEHCTITGEMNRQVVRKFNDLGIWGPKARRKKR